eukprot:725702-Amphidinium_carterae.5
MLLKLCLKPLAKLLGEYIKRSGQTWEMEQRAKEALASGSRTYTMLEFVRLTSEIAFFQELSGLRSSNDWHHLPSSSWTSSFQALCFRALSRMGIATYELLVRPSKAMPLPLFKLLEAVDADALAADILQMPACMLDPFSQHFINTYRVEGLLSKDALMFLHLLCQTASPDTVHLEWSHGRIHRAIHQTSVQTHAPSM